MEFAESAKASLGYRIIEQGRRKIVSEYNGRGRTSVKSVGGWECDAGGYVCERVGSFQRLLFQGVDDNDAAGGWY